MPYCLAEMVPMTLSSGRSVFISLVATVVIIFMPELVIFDEVVQWIQHPFGGSKMRALHFHHTTRLLLIQFALLVSPPHPILVSRRPHQSSHQPSPLRIQLQRFRRYWNPSEGAGLEISQRPVLLPRSH